MELGVITVRCGGMMRDVVMRCIKDVANIWCDLNVAWNIGCGVMWYVSNVKWGVMRDVV